MPTMRPKPRQARAKLDAVSATGGWPEQTRQQSDLDRHGFLAETKARPQSENVTIADVMYPFVETGVGCLEHGDPACLCDVVVDTPTRIDYDACMSYSWGGVSEHDVGSYEWWQNILGVHDSMHMMELLSADGRWPLIVHDRTGELNILKFMLDTSLTDVYTAKRVGEVHGVPAETVRQHRRNYRAKLEAMK